MKQHRNNSYQIFQEHIDFCHLLDFNLYETLIIYSLRRKKNSIGKKFHLITEGLPVSCFQL